MRNFSCNVVKHNIPLGIEFFCQGYGETKCLQRHLEKESQKYKEYCRVVNEVIRKTGEQKYYIIRILHVIQSKT